METQILPEVSDEIKRLENLADYAVLDTPPEETFDDLTRLAAYICEAPIALLTIVDKERQWFKSKFNFGPPETPRTISFCSQAIQQQSDLVIVQDALNDQRFAENPLVTSEPRIRFYAGAPLVSPEGYALGTLCIIDHSPRALTPVHQLALRTLGHHVMTELDLRRRTRALAQAAAKINQHEQATEVLRASELLFHTLAKAAPVGIFRTDANGDCLYVNDRWAEISGLTCEAALGRGWIETLHPDDRDRMLAAWYSAEDYGVFFNAEYRFIKPDGRVTWVLGQGMKEKSEAGEITGYVGTITDITERKDAEDKLRKSEELLRHVMDSSGDCIEILDLEGNVVWMNQCRCRIMKFDHSRVAQGILWRNFWPGEGARVADSALAKAKAGRVGQFTAVCPNYKGEILWWDVLVTPVLDSTGKPEKMLSVSRDVTESRHTERLLAWEKGTLELVSTSAPLREVLEGLMSGLEAQLPDALCSVVLLDPDGKHLRHAAAPALPDAYCGAIDGSLIGPKAGSCGTAMHLGRQVIVSDIEADPLWEHYRELALEHGLRACWSTPLRRSTGQVMGSFAIYYREPRMPTANEMELIDRATHIVSIAIERKQAEEALRESSERLQLVARATNDAVWDWDLMTNKLWWNEGFQTLFGYTPEEIEPGLESWSNRLHPDDLLRVKRSIFDAIHQGSVAWKDEYRFRRRDGSYADIFDRGYVIHDAGGNAVRMIGAMIDISERKRTEEALRNSEERFRQLAENITEVFWVADTIKNRMLYVSPAFAAVWARPCESLYSSPQLWRETIHPEDREQVIEASETKQKRGDYDETYRIVRPDGTVRWIRDRAYPVRSTGGEIYRVVGIAEDITERKTMEAQFLQAQRMETVGRLAGGVAHDINNILAPVVMAVSLLRMGMDQAETDKTLNMIEASAQRGANVAKQLLLFRRGIDGQRGIVNLPELVREIAKIIQQTFLKSIILSVNIPHDIWAIMGDSTQLHQVLLNLCVNARDAMPDGGVLSLQIWNIELDSKCNELSPDARPGPYVQVIIKDTGMGIPGEILNQIFDPFFTTKPIGQGTGLGLSTVLGIMKGHGGFVTVQSRLGAGSTFEVFFPASSHLVEKTSEVSPEWPPAGHDETILVVDDEEHIRDLVSRTLVLHGYHVETANNGSEAVDVYLKNTDKIKLVLSDVDMPTMDGPTMLKILRRINPSLNVIISSGIAGNTMSQSRSAELSALGPITFLEKPYTAEKILWVVHDLLAAGSTVPV